MTKFAWVDDARIEQNARGQAVGSARAVIPALANAPAGAVLDAALAELLESGVVQGAQVLAPAGAVADTDLFRITQNVPAAPVTKGLTALQLKQAIGPGYYPLVAGEVGVTNYTYPVGNILRHGAVGDGVTNDATAFSNAMQSGKRVTIPQPANYYRLTAPVNCTNRPGLVVVHDGTLAQSAETVRIAHAGVGFDCTASPFMEWNRVNVVNDVGFTPQCAWLLARDNTLGNAGINRFNDCHGNGAFVNGFVYNYGSEENEFNDCFWYATSAGTPVMTHTATNIAGLASTFRTIATGTQSTTVLRHKGGSYYHAASSGTTHVLFILDNVADVSFTGAFWYCNLGLAFIRIIGSCDFLSVNKLRCEPGAVPQYGLKFENVGAMICTYISLTECRMTASTNVLYADDNTEIQHLTYRKINDAGVKGVSVKNASYLLFAGFAFVGRALGTIGRSEFVGPMSTWSFLGTESFNTFLDSDNGSLSRPGTFTPVLAIGAGAPTSYTTQIGKFTKLGDRVFFDINIVINVLGAASGAVSVTGLPFAANSNAGENHAVTVKIDGSNLVAGFHTAYVAAGTSVIYLQYTTNANPTVNTNMGQANLNASTSIMLSGSYRV